MASRQVTCQKCREAVEDDATAKLRREAYEEGLAAGLREGLWNSMDNAEIVIAQAIAKWRADMEERVETGEA